MVWPRVEALVNTKPKRPFIPAPRISPLFTPSDQVKLLDAELWLSNRLGHFGEIFAGMTSSADLRERLAEVIAFKSLDCTIAGRSPDGKCETFGDLFERIYKTSLKSVLSKLPK